MLRTCCGPVPVRVPRPKELLTLRGLQEGGEPYVLVHILAGGGFQGLKREDGTHEPVDVKIEGRCPGRPETEFSTSSQKRTDNPVWLHDHFISNPSGSETLELRAVGRKNSQVLDMGRLVLDQLKPHSGTMALCDAKGHPSGAFLHLAVEVGTAHTIEKGWLAQSLRESGKSSEEQSQLYLVWVKQAILMAGMQLQLLSLSQPRNVDPAFRGLTQEGRHQERVSTLKRLLDMRKGLVPISITVSKNWIKTAFAPKETTPALPKRVCTSRTDWVQRRQKFYFIVENGKLKLFNSSHASAKPSGVYSLEEAESWIESEDVLGFVRFPEEQFFESYHNRVSMKTAGSSQKSSPLFLYTNSLTEAKALFIAIRMSKQLPTARDRESLRTILTGVTMQHLKKAWQELFRYARTLDQLKEDYRTFSTKLGESDLARGWKKARVVFDKRSGKEKEKQADEKRKQDVKERADAMERQERQRVFRSLPLRSPQQLRHNAISWVQERFRLLKHHLTVQRSYAASPSRTQQVLKGFTMSCSYQSTKHKDAIRLLFPSARYQELQSDLEALSSATAVSYSEQDLSLGSCHLTVDEACHLLSITETNGDPSRFVNLDQISAVVLHSERTLLPDGRRRPDPELCSGTWITINGPRLCWCRRMRPISEDQNEVVGVQDGQSLMQSLSEGQPVRWLRLTITMGDGQSAPEVAVGPGPGKQSGKTEATIEQQSPPLEKSEVQGQPPSPLVPTQAEKVAESGGEAKPADITETDNPAGRPSSVIFHFLGRQFRGSLATNALKFTAEVPVPLDTSGLAALEESNLTVEVQDQPGEGPARTSWLGKIPLRELFKSAEFAALRTLATQGGAGTQLEETSSAAGLAGKGACVRRSLEVHRPQGPQTIPQPSLPMDLGMEATLTQESRPVRLSPELLGCGPVTQLFSSHRAAWYDPILGQSRFTTGCAANFAELRLRRLLLPPGERPTGLGLWRYCVEARCGGSSSRSPPLLLPREGWQHFVKTDPGTVEFKDTRLFVPLPPGYWSRDRPPPDLRLHVLRIHEEVPPAVDFAEMLKGGVAHPHKFETEKVYHADISIDGMQLDHTYTGLRPHLSRDTEEPSQICVTARVGHPAQLFSARQKHSSAALVLDITLRDRNFVRLTARDQGQRNFLGQDGALCIGSKALLRVEEVIRPPSNLAEYHQFFLPENETDSAPTEVNVASYWLAPLREPCLLHEFDASGLSNQHRPLRERTLPVQKDAIPHKFVLPDSEVDFLQQGRPGSYARILDEFVDKAKVKGHNPETLIVTHLTHLVQHIPCILLATYANRTCDLELSASFVSDWAHGPERKLLLPGTVSVADPPTPASPHRVLLQGVPLHTLTSGQLAGFNVYDTAYGTVEDVIKESPWSPYPLQVGDAAIHAGPLPPDAGPACQYEWSLRVHVQNDKDLRRFLGALRQSVQLCHSYQMAQAQETRLRGHASFQALGVPRELVPPSSSGRLEVVLAEARHLRGLEEFRKGSTLSRLFQGELHTSAVFRIADAEQGQDSEGQQSELEYRGQRTQVSPGLPGSNPNWEAENGLGWVFRTPSFNPLTQQNMFFDVELQHRGQTSLGLVRVPVARPPSWAFPLHVVIKRAYLPGREGDHLHADRPTCHCVCRVEGRPLTEFRTEAVGCSSEVAWNHEVTMLGYQPGEALEFCVYRVAKGGSARLLGAVVIEAGEFDPWGFEDNVTLLEVKDRSDPSLKLKITPLPSAQLGAPNVGSLCDPERPWTSLWLPLCQRDSHAPGGLCEVGTGCLRLSTFWVPDSKGGARSVRQSPRGWLAEELPQGAEVNRVLREPTSGLPVRKGYNPNVLDGEWPRTLAGHMNWHLQGMLNAARFRACVEHQVLELWQNWRGEDKGKRKAPGRTARLRGLWQGSDSPKEAQLLELEELLCHGLPVTWRFETWLELTQANLVHHDLLTRLRVRDPADAQEANVALISQQVREQYRLLVKHGRAYQTEASRQLQEDLIALSSWEPVREGAQAEVHRRRLRRAEDVCRALWAFSSEQETPLAFEEKQFTFQDIKQGEDDDSCGVLYCESLLVVAFFLLLMQETEGPPNARTSLAKKDQAEKSKVRASAAEVATFLLLYALAGSGRNQAFRDYYGVPKASTLEDDLGQAPLCDGHGAMRDVHFLGSCLATLEVELWIHLNALGFHLSTVFYGAFMRLFALLLPSATLWRFWDVLFSQSSRPGRASQKPARHSLVDLAFGTIQGCKQTLLACQSAEEVRDCLICFLESLYDPTAMIKLMCEAESLLWPSSSFPQAQAPHVVEADKQRSQWETHVRHFRKQNHALKEIIQNIADLPEIRLEGPGANDDENPADHTGRVTTGYVASLAKALTEHLADRPQRQTSGTVHVTPPELRLLGLPSDEGVFQKLGRIASKLVDLFPGCAADEGNLHHSVSVPATGISGPEPEIAENAFTDAVHLVTEVVGPDQHYRTIFRAFESQDHGFSLNEFLSALICCSRGTAGEKAVALFDLYAGDGPLHKVPHCQPVSHLACAVVQRCGGSSSEALQNLPVPKAEDVVTMALHFSVFEAIGTQERLIGEAFVPSLSPHLWGDAGVEEPFTLEIWGREKRRLPTLIPEHLQPDRPRVGEMDMVIKWTPNTPENVTVGQLVLRLVSLKFNDLVDAQYLKNPSIAVVVYDHMGNPRPVERGKGHFQSNPGSPDNFIKFGRTMWQDNCNRLQHYPGIAHHGWDSLTGHWRWNHKYGTQFSNTNLVVQRGWAAGQYNAQPKTISLRACRLLTQHICDRSLYFITNRQAALLADQTFSRAGAVPAILNALVVTGETFGSNGPRDVEQLKVQCKKEGRRVVDVKRQLVFSQEALFSHHPGSLQLLPERRGGPAAHSGAAEEKLKETLPAPPARLLELGIADPFPGSKKILWLRLARAGDGSRQRREAQVNERGEFAQQDLSLEMGTDNVAGRIQESLTKEEFVSCLLACPLLSEPLRQFSYSCPDISKPPALQPLRLECVVCRLDTIEENQLEDLVRVKQAVLLEIWDSKADGQDAFLGECYLPELSTLSRDSAAFVLSVGAVPPTSQPTRPDDRKLRKRAQARTGQLFVEASWCRPAMDAKSQPNMQADERLETGRLRLNIVKAQGLTLAKGSKSRGVQPPPECTPYVSAYIRNEAFQEDEEGPGFSKAGWRCSEPGVHEEMLRTTAKKATDVVFWGESFDLLLRIGDAEKRIAGDRLFYEKLGVSGMFESTDVPNAALVPPPQTTGPQARVGFGGLGVGAGEAHFEQVYASDTIQDFTTKVAKACRQLASKEMSTAKRQVYEAASFGVPVGQPVGVEAFIEAQRDQPQRALGQRTGEWVPLDPLLTFEHYARQLGLGRPSCIPRLRLGGTTAENSRRRLLEVQRRRSEQRAVYPDSEEVCCGHAAFPHPADGGLTEWRPALLRRAEGQKRDAARRFLATFPLAPLTLQSDLAAGVGQSVLRMDEDGILLAPLRPKMLNLCHLELRPYLSKALELQQSGLTDKEIVIELNKESQEQMEACLTPEGETMAEQRRPAITLEDVHRAIRWGRL